MPSEDQSQASLAEQIQQVIGLDDGEKDAQHKSSDLPTIDQSERLITEDKQETKE